MTYTVVITRRAEKDMDRLPPVIHAQISSKILTLEQYPRPPGSKKLSASESYRMRVGDYRFLYTIDDSDHAVSIMTVGHCKDVYR